MYPGPQQKPFGRYNWKTGNVEPLESDPGDDLYDAHFPPTSSGGGRGAPPRGPQPLQSAASPAPTPQNMGKPWQRKVRGAVDRVTGAQMRQAAFRGPHGLVQGVRYAAGLPPIGRNVIGIYQAEALQNLALNPRQFLNDGEDAQ